MIAYKLLLFLSFVISFADKTEDMAAAETVAENIFNETSNSYDEFLNINRTDELEFKRTQDLKILNRTPKNLRQAPGIKDKQLLLTRPRPVGLRPRPFFPFRLTPAALLIPAIPTLLGEETNKLKLSVYFLYCRPRRWTGLGGLSAKSHQHHHIRYWVSQH
jgi:hypothetical protein